VGMDLKSEEMTPEKRNLPLTALNQIPYVEWWLLSESPEPVGPFNKGDKQGPFWYDFAEMLREEMKGPCGPLG
jgi:hypothetical protein